MAIAFEMVNGRRAVRSEMHPEMFASAIKSPLKRVLVLLPPSVRICMAEVKIWKSSDPPRDTVCKHILTDKLYGQQWRRDSNNVSKVHRGPRHSYLLIDLT
jgi:hypothetical protein